MALTRAVNIAGPISLPLLRYKQKPVANTVNIFTHPLCKKVKLYI
jgi:hypothetical protein